MPLKVIDTEPASKPPEVGQSDAATGNVVPISRTPAPWGMRANADPKPKSEAKSRLYTWMALRDLPPPAWLLKPILPEGYTRIVGPPGVGKTFLALDWSLALAVAGRRVLYIAAEGARGLPIRVRAWLKSKDRVDHPLENFVIHKGGLDIGSKDAVLALVRALGPDATATLVVIDTQSRCFGGGDENSTRDMERFNEGCMRLQEALGASVLVLHHPGKDERKGGRGSSAGTGALDAEIRLQEKDGVIEVSCTKMKEDDEFDPFYLELSKMHRSCVMIPAEKPAETVSESDLKAWKLLPLDGTGLPFKEWREAVLTVLGGSEKPAAQKKAMQRVVKSLKGAGLLRVEDGMAYRLFGPSL